MKKILIQNIEVEGRRTSILINGNTIAKIADGITCPGAEIIDGTGKAAIPGLVNMHTHAAMTLMRGVEEDIVLSKWLQRIWAIESRLDSEMIYWGTKLAIIEMIHTGTTTFLDHYWHIPQAYKAAEELGIRGYFSFVHLDGFNQDKADRDFAEFEKEYQESFGWEHPERFSVAIHA
ncbi:MAG: amidohydrolase family protein, partial [Bacteroidales bacterium]|nr:amidohydrolase family protein [Bacteroidales bacterium]